MHTNEHAALVRAVSNLNRCSVVLCEVAELVETVENRLGIIAQDTQPGSEGNGAPSVQDGAAHNGEDRVPWVWVSGNTKPYRELFKAEGGRWSPKRQAWFFIGVEQLPPHLNGLPGTTVEVSR